MGSPTANPIDHSVHPRVNSADPVPPRPLPATPAHVLTSDDEAIRVAQDLAADFARDPALRDREGLLPLRELDLYSQSGIWSINVPKAYGGPGLSHATLAKVISIVASGDPADEALSINADAKILAATLKAGESLTYDLAADRRAYLVPAVGRVDVNGTTLNARDGAAIAQEDVVTVKALSDAEIVLVDAA